MLLLFFMSYSYSFMLTSMFYLSSFYSCFGIIPRYMFHTIFYSFVYFSLLASIFLATACKQLVPATQLASSHIYYCSFILIFCLLFHGCIIYFLIILSLFMISFDAIYDIFIVSYFLITCLRHTYLLEFIYLFILLLFIYIIFILAYFHLIIYISYIIIYVEFKVIYSWDMCNSQNVIYHLLIYSCISFVAYFIILIISHFTCYFGFYIVIIYAPP